MKRRRILIVDDHLDYVQSIAALLRAKGHEVSFAINGTVALAEARKFHPDVVMLDIKLPNGDGRELARRLRQEAGVQRIACVTGLADEDPRKSLEAGCDFHYLKPLQPADLDKLLENPRGGTA